MSHPWGKMNVLIIFEKKTAMNFRTLLFALLLSGFGLTAGHGQTRTGIFDSQTDVGNPSHPGFAFYNEKDQTYTVGGSGENMWFDNDQFHYLWTTLQGDFILRAEVSFLGAGVEAHRKAGWIVRNSLEAAAPHVNATVHGDGLTSLQYRPAFGGETREMMAADSFADVLQLERQGNTWIFSSGRFGEPLHSVTLDSLVLNKEVYAGIYVCAHNPGITETAVFRNVRIIKPAGHDLVPYRDYLGSRLEIMDVETGLRRMIFTSAHSIQAPNWTPDGKYLIFNSGGLLYRYDLHTGNIGVLNTGFARSNNNDHVLTFDGTLLGISHHSSDEGGNSAIFYLPASGSDQPVRITRPGRDASYLHGWAPDNHSVVFTGHRNGQYDIYSADIRTGQEIRLTHQQTLDDGPEYSPDGKYIFFNSARTGTMQLWRMKPDGSEQTQLTFDAWNDWFPHVSPDMKKIIFISFPPEVDAQDHPFYKRCLLRMMPYEGGEPTVIGYVYGGQGTMNVPNWSPDSRKIAFVTNSGPVR